MIDLWSRTTGSIAQKMNHFAPVKCCKSIKGDKKENLINYV